MKEKVIGFLAGKLSCPQEEINEDTWVTLIIPRDKHRPDSDRYGCDFAGTFLHGSRYGGILRHTVQ